MAQFMSFQNIKIGKKLPILIVGFALLAAMVTGISGYLIAEQALEKEAFAKLEAIQQSRAAELGRYLDSIEQDLNFQAENPLIATALKDFTAAFATFEGDATATLQAHYIYDNPFPTGQKEELDYALDGSAYSAAHGQHHGFLRTFLRERDYYDIFLFDTQGNLVYSVFKELDYATNLITGDWADTDLGNAFRSAANTPQAGSISFFDFKPYAPSNDAPASFISTPVFDDAGVYIGVLAFQMPIARINQIMMQQAGMGESGEAYIIGEDHLMRSDSRFSEDSTILTRKVQSTTAQSALKGDTGALEVEDYRGVPVFSAFGSIDFHGARWAILAEVDSEEVRRPAVDMRNLLALLAIGLAVVLSGLGFAAGSSIANPIAHMADSMDHLAKGDLEVIIPGCERGDEIGDMASAVQIFKTNAEDRKRLEQEQQDNAIRAEQEKRDLMEQLANNFQSAVGSIIESLTHAASAMQSDAETMQSAADQAISQSSIVTSAADQASMNVQSVASATEQMTASVSEIRRQAQSSADTSRDAVSQANETSAIMEDLSEAAEKIGAVVKLITDIADQTNLLALNATIEAARAGDAGKGFGVVASEVKSLAQQTQSATSEIAEQVSAIQDATTKSVTSIERIGQTINTFSVAADSISNAVEEQDNATMEISQNVQQAAQGTTEVSSSITTVNEAAKETGGSAAQVVSVSKDISDQAISLRASVEGFLKQVRAA